MSWLLGGLLAQEGSGAAAFAVLLNLAILALMIYLVYAIIATRQDVALLRERLVDGGSVEIRSSGG